MDIYQISKEQIEKLMNIINSLPLKEGNNFVTASKVSEIYNIINGLLKDKQIENKTDK
jgi:hypothetical protein